MIILPGSFKEVNYQGASLEGNIIVIAIIAASLAYAVFREPIEKTLTSLLRGTLSRIADSTVNVAALLAGRSYPWAAEAWRADLLTKADGSDDPMPPWRRPVIALGMLLFTAPKMRLLKLTWRIEYTARRFGRWLLFCDPATDALIGALAVTVTALLAEDLGFWVALAVATAISLCAVQGAILLRKRLRNSTSSSPE